MNNSPYRRPANGQPYTHSKKKTFQGLYSFKNKNDTVVSMIIVSTVIISLANRRGNSGLFPDYISLLLKFERNSSSNQELMVLSIKPPCFTTTAIKAMYYRTEFMI